MLSVSDSTPHEVERHGSPISGELARSQSIKANLDSLDFDAFDIFTITRPATQYILGSRTQALDFAGMGAWSGLVALPGTLDNEHTHDTPADLNLDMEHASKSNAPPRRHSSAFELSYSMELDNSTYEVFLKSSGTASTPEMGSDSANLDLDSPQRITLENLKTIPAAGNTEPLKSHSMQQWQNQEISQEPGVTFAYEGTTSSV